MGHDLTGLHASAGVSPGLLFDWAIPLMSAYASDGTKASEGSVYWALSALQHGLRGCDSRAVTRYGNALLGACQALMEAEALPEHLLPQLLDVIVQVWCHYRTRCNAHSRPLCRDGFNACRQQVTRIGVGFSHRVGDLLRSVP